MNSFDPLPQQQEEGQIVKSGLLPGPFPHGKRWSTLQKAAHQEQPSQHNPTGNRPCCHVLCLIFLYQHYLAEQNWAYRRAWSTNASEALPPLLRQNLQGILMTHKTNKQTNKPLASFVISVSLCWKPSRSLSHFPLAVGTLVQCFNVVLGCPLLFLPHSVTWPCREVSTASCWSFVPVPGNLLEFSFAVQNLQRIPTHCKGAGNKFQKVQNKPQEEIEDVYLYIYLFTYIHSANIFIHLYTEEMGKMKF